MNLVSFSNNFSRRLMYLIGAIIVIFTVVLMYYYSFDYFFLQDDFFHLSASRAKSFTDFILFFKFQDKTIDYRPLTNQVYHFSLYSLFGLNPVPFRLVNFTFFILTYLMMVKVIARLTRNKMIGFLTATFWILSSAHFMLINWIAGAWLIIGTFFFLLCSFSFIKFSKDKRIIFYFSSLILFLITATSFEFFIAWPIIFGYYYYHLCKNSLGNSVKVFSPFISITLAYVVIRSLLIPLPRVSEYSIAVNLETIKTLFWYILWSFNIPEEFKKQIVTNLFIFNKTFISEFWPLVLKSILGAFLIFLMGIIIPTIRIIKKKWPIDLPLIAFSIIWFLSGIALMVILPKHTFAMYLAFPSIGIYLLIAYLLVQNRNLFLIMLTMLIWITTSVVTLTFYKQNSWVIESQRFAREFSYLIKRQFPKLPGNAVILFPLKDSPHIQALSGSNALQAIYDDQTLSIYYNREALLKDVNTISNRPVYIYIRSQNTMD